LPLLDFDRVQLADRRPGRTTRSFLSLRRGRHLRSLSAQGLGVGAGRVDLNATLKAGFLRYGNNGFPGRPGIEDVQFKIFRQRQKALIVFLVDASDSMGEGTIVRIRAAKGAVLAWLATAYQKRDQVAVIAFRGRQAETLLEPTSSIVLARRKLRQLHIGGATPFAAALDRAVTLVRAARRKTPQIKPLLVVISDGEANVPLVAGRDIIPELLSLGRTLKLSDVRTLIVDSGSGPAGGSVLRQLAGASGGQYRKIEDLHSGRLLAAIRRSGDEGRGG
jgi:magnesium chelatase subunit D